MQSASHSAPHDLAPERATRSARSRLSGPGARMFAFRTACLGLEAAWVVACGLPVARTWQVGLPEPGAMGLAFAVVLLLSGGCIAPPAQDRRGRALHALAALFVVATALMHKPLVSLPAMLVWFAFAFAGVVALRVLALRVALRLPGLLPEPRPVAFIGNSDSAARMLRQLEADPLHRTRVIGFFDDRYNRPGPLHGLIPCLGHVDDLVSYIHDHEIHDVYMALPWSAGDRISTLIERLRFLPLTVRLVPDQVPPALRGQAEVDQFEGVVMPTLMLPPFSAVGAVAKRSCDMVLSLLLLVPMSVLFLLVAIVIKLDSRGPVFFRQQRSGQYGRSFGIYKFRSLHVAQADGAAETLVTHGDRRVTRVGKYLRKYSIDELPQILNVVLGDMSLVGPRPHAARAKADGKIYAEVMPDYMLRYRVKPGMTGWAQVNGWRGNTDTEEKLRKRVEFDFAYIKTWSISRDFVILLKTIPSVLMPPPENA